MITAAQLIEDQRQALKDDIDQRLADNPDFAQRLAAASPEDQARFREDVLKKAMSKPEYRAYAVLHGSGFAQVLERYDQQHQLSDDEMEQALGAFVKGVDKYKPEDRGVKVDYTAVVAPGYWLVQQPRAQENFRDAMLGVADVGSITGMTLDQGRFPVKRQADAIRKTEYLLEKLGDAPKHRGKLETRLAKQKEAYRKTAIEYLPVLAERQGRYAGLSDWDGAVEGLVALSGQLAGAAPSPENLIGGGKSLAKSRPVRMAMTGLKEGAANVVANAMTEGLVQSHRQATGQQEGFSWQGALVRSGLGFLLGGGAGAVRGFARPSVELGGAAKGADTGVESREPTKRPDKAPDTPEIPLDDQMRRYDEKFGKIVDADKAREIVSDAYAASWDGKLDNAALVHEDASALSKRQFAWRLQQPGEGDVLFTAGGGGSGKGYAMDQIVPELEENAHTVFDGTFGGLESARQKMLQALDEPKNGPKRNVQVVFVYKPVDESYKMMVRRAIGDTLEKGGRQVPLKYFLEAHDKALVNWLTLREEFKANPRVKFTLIEKRYADPAKLYTEEGGEILRKALDFRAEQVQVDIGSQQTKLFNEAVTDQRKQIEGSTPERGSPIPPSEFERRVGRIAEAQEVGPHSRESGRGDEPGHRQEEGEGDPVAAQPAELPATEHPVIEVPVKDIQLSKDAPNFKEDADPKTGVVAGQELKAKKYIRLGTSPIVVWERLDGRKEVITGRHRLDLARRTGEETIPAQVVREADGFDIRRAMTFDAESNIRAGQGSVRDYAHYFRESGIDRATAEQRGLTGRVKGDRGWAIGRGAGDDLYALYRNKRISEAKAAALGRAAPGDDAVQRAGIGKAREMGAEELEVFAGNLRAMREAGPGVKQDQGDLFGADDTAILEAERIAKEAGKRIRKNTERILAVKGAVKRPETAREMGVDVKDPDAIHREIVRLLDENEQLKRPGGNLLRSLREDAGLVKPEPLDVSVQEAGGVEKLESWADDVIKEARDQGTLFSGLDPKLMSAYAVKGAMLLARGVRDFAEWSKAMIKELGAGIEDHLDGIYKESIRVNKRVRAEAEAKVAKAEKEAAEQGQKVRGFSKRAAVDLREDADQVLADPSTRYTQQDLKEETSRLDELNDTELMSLLADKSTDNNLSILAGIRLRDRLLDRGEDASAVRQILEQKGTTFGQLIRQFREVKSSPGNLVDLVEKELELKGRTLTQAQRDKLYQLAKAQEAARRSREKTHAAARKRFTEESGDQVAAADKSLGEAARKLDQFVAGLVPESSLELLAKVMQGNLLTLRSLVQNVLGNLMLAPMRGGRHLVASALDAVWSKATGKERTLFSPLGSLPEQAAGAIQGVRTATEALLKGQGDMAYVKGEIQRGFRPLRSLVQAWTAKDMAVDAKTGRVRMSDRVKRLMEAMLGGPPEVMFRLLRLGDDPFRLAVRRAELANQARLKGFERGSLEWKQFMLVPPKAAEEVAEQVGKRATFQQDNAFSKWLMTGEKMLDHAPWIVGQPLKFLFKLVAPFRQFPVNYVATAVDYVAPPVSFAKAMYHGAKGNRRQSLEALGASVVGGTAWAAAEILWNNELTTPPIQWDDPKLKGLQYQGNQKGIPSGSLNVSGLRRLMSGGDPKHRVGDRYIQYEGLGIPGMIMWMKSSHEFGKQKRQATGENVDNQAVELLKTFPKMTSFMLDQTFLAGINGMMQAVMDWERFGEHWASNLFRAVASIPAPNTLQSLNNARWEAIPELKGNSQAETFANIWNYKTLQLAPDHPVKINMWGEPAARTGQGAQPYVYNMLDPMKWQTSEQDSRTRTLWSAWRQTGNTGVIPGAPSKRFYHFGQEYELTPEQHMQLQMLVGRERAKLLDDFYPSPEALPRDPAMIERGMQRIWDHGLQAGKLVFLGQVPMQGLKPVDERQAVTSAVDPY